MIYLDNNATTMVDPLVVSAMQPYLEHYYGNPSSIHSFGQQAFKKIEEVKDLIGKKIGCSGSEIFFTSSGTESNNLCLLGFAKAHRAKGNHIITSKIEHASILKPLAFLEKMGFDITYLDVDAEGFVDPQVLRKSIKKETILISIGHANSEIGTLQPLEELVEVAESIPFHTDAIQSFLKVDLDVQKLNLALVAFSGHKFHAPKGIGFIYKRKDIELEPLIYGGRQEGDLRAGTENVSGIVGLGAAIQNYHEQDVVRMRALQKKLLAELTDRFGVKINGPQNYLKRVCTNVNVSFDRVEGETILKGLSDAHIFISTGSACSSKKSRISHVMKSINCPPAFLHGNIRIGLSKFTTQEEIETFLETISRVISHQSHFSLGL